MEWLHNFQGDDWMLEQTDNLVHLPSLHWRCQGLKQASKAVRKYEWVRQEQRRDIYPLQRDKSLQRVRAKEVQCYTCANREAPTITEAWSPSNNEEKRFVSAEEARIEGKKTTFQVLSHT